MLTAGTTCWRKETAARAALLIDMETYFDAAMDAMSRAKHCVHLRNWAFDAKAGGVGEALEVLRQSGYRRLRPIEPKSLHPLAAFVAAYHIGDPVGPRDSWRPWKRVMAVAAEARVATQPKAPRRLVGPSATAP